MKGISNEHYIKRAACIIPEICPIYLKKNLEIKKGPFNIFFLKWLSIAISKQFYSLTNTGKIYCMTCRMPALKRVAAASKRLIILY